jgi:HEAT repeat protein
LKLPQWQSKPPDIEALKSKGDITGLLKALERREIHTRVAAINALGDLGDKRAIEPLLLLLHEEDAQICGSAIRVLAKLEVQRAVEPIISLLSSANKSLRLAAIEALGQLMAHQAVSPLANTLQEEDPNLRLAVVHSLGQIRDVGAVEPLISALKDKKREVRWAAADTLDQLGWHPNGEDIGGAAYWVAKRRWNKSAEYGAAAVEPLIVALEDDPFSVAEALVQLGEPAVMPLVGALEHSDKNVRWAVVGALEQLGDTRAVEPLIKSLQRSDSAELWMALKLGVGSPLAFAVTGLDKKLRWSTIQALGKLGDARATEPLTELFKTEQDEELHQVTITALGQLKDARAVEPLVEVLQSPNPDTRKRAVEALKCIGDERAVKPLAGLLQDTDAELRLSALDALGSLGSPAIESLVAALKDESMRIQVANILGKLGKPALSPVLEFYQRETDLGVRQACLWVFGHLEDEIAVDVLMVALRKDNVLCYSAANALSNLGAPDAAKKYISFLKEIEGEQMLTMLKRVCDACVAQDRTNIAGLEPQAKIIGQELCYRGGAAEMQRLLTKLGGYNGAENINRLWAGIGDWSPKKEGAIGDLGKDKGSEGTGMGL